MNVFNEIIQNSAAGNLSKGYKGAVVLLFAAIVVMLFLMLATILINGPHLHISYGY